MSIAIETTWKQKRGRLARLSQDLPAGHPDLDALRRDIKAARTAEYIEKILSEAPPLTDEQRTRLAELLRPARRSPPDRKAAVQARLAELDSGGAA